MFIFQLYHKIPLKAQFVCLHLNLWMAFLWIHQTQSADLMSVREDPALTSVQLCMTTPSSNYLIRHTIQNIRGIRLQIPRLLNRNWKLWSPQQEDEDIVLIGVYCFVFCASYPSLPLVHTSQWEGEETTHQHCRIVKEKSRRKIMLFCNT